MTGNPVVEQVLGGYLLKVIAGVLITAGIGVFMFPLRFIRKEWKAIKTSLDGIHLELSHQRTNCLATLQNQGTSQVELLQKSSDTLAGIRIDLADQAGFLRALVAPEQPRKRRNNKK